MIMQAVHNIQFTCTYFVLVLFTQLHLEMLSCNIWPRYVDSIEDVTLIFPHSVQFLSFSTFEQNLLLPIKV